MEWSIDISPDGRRLTVTAHGPASPDGFRAYRQAIAAEMKGAPPPPTLVDLRDVDLAAMSAAQIRELAEMYDRLAPALTSPIAAVVTRPVDFGLVRMWQAHIDPLGLKHQVFYSIAEAEEWLRAAG